jgi:hypothetical protein
VQVGINIWDRSLRNSLGKGRVGGRKAQRKKVRKAHEDRTDGATRPLGNFWPRRRMRFFTQKIQVGLDKRLFGARAPLEATISPGMFGI